MSCPNCGAYGMCRCTWDEQAEAIRILARRDAQQRKVEGKPTVVEKEAAIKTSQICVPIPDRNHRKA
jgi:hypothetical protein